MSSVPSIIDRSKIVQASRKDVNLELNLKSSENSENCNPLDLDFNTQVLLNYSRSLSPPPAENDDKQYNDELEETSSNCDDEDIDEIRIDEVNHIPRKKHFQKLVKHPPIAVNSSTYHQEYNVELQISSSMAKNSNGFRILARSTDTAYNLKTTIEIHTTISSKVQTLMIHPNYNMFGKNFYKNKELPNHLTLHELGLGSKCHLVFGVRLYSGPINFNCLTSESLLLQPSLTHHHGLVDLVYLTSLSQQGYEGLVQLKNKLLQGKVIHIPVNFEGQRVIIKVTPPPLPRDNFLKKAPLEILRKSSFNIFVLPKQIRRDVAEDNENNAIENPEDVEQYPTTSKYKGFTAIKKERVNFQSSNRSKRLNLIKSQIDHHKRMSNGNDVTTSYKDYRKSGTPNRSDDETCKASTGDSDNKVINSLNKTGLTPEWSRLPMKRKNSKITDGAGDENPRKKRMEATTVSNDSKKPDLEQQTLLLEMAAAVEIADRTKTKMKILLSVMAGK
eukprot:Awhi_evm1s529